MNPFETDMAFSWAHIVAGKTLGQVLREKAEKQAKEAKAAAAQKIKDEEDRVCLLKKQEYEERMLRHKQHQQEEYLKKQEQAREREERIAEEERKARKARDALRTRENGYWSRTTTKYEEGSPRDVDPKFNVRVIDFIQLWFTIWGDVLFELKTLKQLEEKFYEHFCPWLITQFSRDSSEVKYYIETKAGGDITTIPSHTQYVLVQLWVEEQEKTYREPWAELSVWTPAKHITWPNVLRILTKKSVSFRQGLVSVSGDKKTLNWKVSFPYKTVKFNKKAISPAEQARRSQQALESLW